MGNMYPEYEGKTINFIGGKCPHECVYCYVQTFKMPFLRQRYSGEPFLVIPAFKENLGKNKRWFPNSCHDINTVPLEWRIKIADRLCEFPTNIYLIQSKNPRKFNELLTHLPLKTILGTTAETNGEYNLSKAPQPADRLIALAYIKTKFPKMISIEPVVDFDLDMFVALIKDVRPSYVSIGLDTKNKGLKRPSDEKILMLIDELNKFTEVRMKESLKALKNLSGPVS